MEEKCEYYKVEEDDSQLFLKEEKYVCKLENCDCMFDGDEKVCPFRIGVYY